MGDDISRITDFIRFSFDLGGKEYFMWYPVYLSGAHKELVWPYFVALEATDTYQNHYFVEYCKMMIF